MKFPAQDHNANRGGYFMRRGHHLATLLAIGAVTIAIPALSEPEPAKGKAAEESQRAASAAAADSQKKAGEKGAGEKASPSKGSEGLKARMEGKTEAKGASAEAHAMHQPEKIQAKLAEMRQNREERKKARQDELLKKWGDKLLEHAAVRAELKVNARRSARLQRMLTLAEASEKPNKAKIVARINKLIEKEQERHQKHMEALQKDPTGASVETVGHQTGTPGAAPGAAGEAAGKKGVGTPGSPGKSEQAGKGATPSQPMKAPEGKAADSKGGY
jgi:hypothetical protein